MIATQLRDLVIRPTLKHIGMWSEAAENLLLGTIFQESAGGKYIKQLGTGPALGIYQIEPDTNADVWNNYIEYRVTLWDKVAMLMTGEDDKHQLVTNLSYQTAIARLIYYRAPFALPDANDINGLAHYWKQHYNTVLGAGTVEEFIHNFPKGIIK